MLSSTRRVRAFSSLADDDETDGPTATLKNDDPEESEEDGEDDPALAEERERRLLERERTQKRSPTEKQPTGRVVGIIKRNWRA